MWPCAREHQGAPRNARKQSRAPENVREHQGAPGNARGQQKLEKPRTDSPQEPPEGAQSCQHLQYGLLAPRTIGE